MNSYRQNLHARQIPLAEYNPRYNRNERQRIAIQTESGDAIDAKRTSTTVVPWTGANDRRLSRRMNSVTEDNKALLLRALAGDGQSVNRLVNLLTPVVQTRVARKLLGQSSSGDIRQDVKDYTQDVFLQLFENNGRILKGWQAERGMSLENYVGLVTERRVISLLRSGKRNPWRERDGLDEVSEPVSAEADVATQVQHADTLDVLLDSMRQALSPRGWQLFELLYIRECSVDEMQLQTGLSADAIYAWRSRLRKTARECQQELNSEPPVSSPIRKER